MENSNRLTANNYKKSTRSLKCKILIVIILILCFSLISSIFFIQYKAASKTAENSVAIYLSQNHKPENNDYFMSFKKVYSSVEFKNFKYVVELGGSANIGYVGKFTHGFYAKVEITPFTNKVKIEKLTLNGKKVKKP